MAVVVFMIIVGLSQAFSTPGEVPNRLEFSGVSVSGRVNETNVANRQRVEKRDLLIALDRQEIDATIGQLAARLDSAKATQWRLQALLDSVNSNSQFFVIKE